MLARFLRENGITAEIVTLSGAVEIAPRLGRADLICDLVSTGSTLTANHLREVAVVLESQVCLVRTPVALPDVKADWVRRLLVRIDGVQQVRESKYIMLHAPRSALPQIAKLLPGSESPDGHSARRHRRQGRGARRLPRDRVLGDAREPEGRRRQRGAGAAGREDARMKSPLDILDWSTLDEARRDAVLRRPAQRDAAGLLDAGAPHRRRRARRAATRRCASTRRSSTACSSSRSACRTPSSPPPKPRSTPVQRAALERAIDTVTRFHELQTLPPLRLETAPGVVCERMTVPLEAVGLYVPAGTAPLPSTALMLAVPASIAGCPVRVMCTPPAPGRHGRSRRAGGGAALRRAQGVQARRRAGRRRDGLWHGDGAQGRQDLRAGQRLGHGRQADRGARMPTARRCDMPAGPSEVLVIADDAARPAFVAADLLAQAEHSVRRAGRAGHDLAQAWPRPVRPKSARQLAALPRTRHRGAGDRRQPRHHRADHRDGDGGLEPLRAGAPDPAGGATRATLLPQVRNAGSVFLGAWTPETMGDYCSGTNHVLPTYGHARAYSGLSRARFRQAHHRAGTDCGRACATSARWPHAGAASKALDAHANAVTVRLDALAQAGHA